MSKGSGVHSTRDFFEQTSCHVVPCCQAQRASTPKEVPIAGGPERFTMADLKGRLPVHLGALSKRTLRENEI